MKVSVSIVTYNQEEFIAETIESALMQQTDFDFEIVIGEDCSTDRTREIVMEYQKNYPDKIRLTLRDENIGMNPNFFDTIARCNGEYVALLDGDDVWTDENKLQKQADLLDSDPSLAICFHNVNVEYTDGSRETYPFHTTKTEYEIYSPVPQQISTIEKIIAGNFMQTCSVMFRNKLFGEVPEWFYGLNIGDWPLHILNAQYGKIAYIDEIMARYRVHPKSVWTTQSHAERCAKLIEVYEKFNEFFNFRYTHIIDRERRYYYAEIVNANINEAVELIKSGSSEDALGLLNKAVEICMKKDFSPMNLFFIRAVCYIQLNKFDHAYKDLDVELKLNPDNERAKKLIDEIKITKQSGTKTNAEKDSSNTAKQNTAEQSEKSNGNEFSIIIPVFNNFAYTLRCIDGILKTSGIYHPEIIIVDNGSSDGTSDYLKKLTGNIKIIENPTNVSYSKANNQGAEIASGKYLVFLNNDTEPFPGWLDAFEYEFDNNSQTAVQGAKLLYENGHIQHAGMVFGKRPGRPEEPYHAYLMAKQDEDFVSRKRHVQFVTGACMAIRKDVFDDVGGFDEEYEFGWEDTDLCVRVRLQGHEILYNPEAVLFHYESVTKKLRQEMGDNIMDTTSPREHKNRERFFEKWNGKILNDADAFYAEDGFQLRGGKLVKVRDSIKVNTADGKTAEVELVTSLSPKFWNRNYNKASTVLIRTSAAIGDALAITAIASDLKRQYPHLTIFVAGEDVILGLFENHPDIEELLPNKIVEENHIDNNFDIVIDYTWEVARLADYYNGLPYLDVLGNVAGFKFAGRKIVYSISDEEKAEAASHFNTLFDMGKLIGVHFSTMKDPKRSYPFGNKVIAELLEIEPTLRFLHLGLEELGVRHDSVIDCAATSMDLRKQIAMAANCDAFLTIDSVFFHIGHNLFDKPTMVIAGPTNPKLIGNPAAGFEYVRNESLDCLNCYWRKRCDIECMRELSPKIIAEAFMKII